MSTCTIASGESVSTCQQSLQYFQQAVEEEQAKRNASLTVWTKYDSDYTNWQNALSAWTTDKANFQRNWEAGRRLTASNIWDGNSVADCNNVPTATYTDAFGWVTYTRNCNDVAGSLASKCHSCGYHRCDCTAGLDQWCKTDRCGEYQYNANYSTYPGPTPKTWATAESEWLYKNPKPIQPIPPDSTKYPDFRGDEWPNFPNIICQSCTQCMDFTNLTADQINISQLQQSCINKLQAPAPVTSPVTSTAPAPAPTPTSPAPAPAYTAPAPTYTAPAPPAYTPTPSPIYIPKPSPAPLPASSQPTKNTKTIMLMVLLLILVIIIGILAGFYYYFAESDDDADYEYSYNPNEYPYNQ
jgi:hypothetical protein